MSQPLSFLTLSLSIRLYSILLLALFPCNNMPGEAKRRKVTVETKLAIIEYLDTPGASIRRAAEKFDVSKKVVQGAKAKKVELLSHRDNNLCLNVSRLVGSKEVNVLLFRWFTIVRAQGFPVSGAILQEKAKEIGADLGLDSFAASEGWLSNWKKKHNVTLRTISGESGNVDEVTADQWKNSLKSICSGYLPKDIFNAKKFTVLDAINFVSRSWVEVTAETIAKCFRNSGFDWEEDDEERSDDATNDDVDESLGQYLAQVGITEPVLEENVDAFEPLDGDNVLVNTKYVLLIYWHITM